MIFYNNQIDETFRWICIFRKLCTILMKLNILGRKILPIKNISLFLLENPISQMSAERGSRRVFR